MPNAVRFGRRKVLESETNKSGEEEVLDTGTQAMKVIAYRPEIARELGSIPAAIYYQQLCHWQQHSQRPDNFIFKSAKEFEQETYISPMQQRKCREILESRGWIEIKKELAKGAPTLHFKVLAFVNTTIRFVKTTNAFVKNNKSITKNTHENTTLDKYTSEFDEQVKKVYGMYLVYFKIGIDIYESASSDEKPALLQAASKNYRLTPKRRNAIITRIKDIGFPAVKRAMMNIGASDFHRGDNDRGWTAELDWVYDSYEKCEKWANKGKEARV